MDLLVPSVTWCAIRNTPPKELLPAERFIVTKGMQVTVSKVECCVWRSPPPL